MSQEELMTAEVVKKISERTDGELSESQCQEVLNSFVDTISEALHEGQEVRFRGLGRFGLKTLQPREYPVPGTNRTVQKGERQKVKFTPYKKLRLDD